MNNNSLKSKKDQLITSWLDKKKLLANNAIDHESSNHGFRKVYQRGIYWVEMGENVGREMGRLHPALVISDNKWNDRGTATILPLSSELEQLWDTRYILLSRNYPKEILESGRELPGLSKDSLVKADQPKTASVERFKGQLAKVNPADWNIIQKRIKKYLSI